MTTAHLISRDEVMAFLDGELAPPRAAIVRAHVDGCSECGAVVSGFRAITDALRDWRVEPAPDTLAAPRALVAPWPAASRAASTGVFGAHTFWRAAPWLAAAAAVVVVSYVVMPRLSAPLDDRRFDAETVTGPAAVGAPAAPSSSVGGVAQRDGPGQALKKTLDKDSYDGEVARAVNGVAALEEAKQAPSDPRMIVRNASLGLSTDRFDDVLRRMQTAAERHGGTVSAYQVAGSAADGRSLSATVRVPVGSMDAALADLRRLGTVTGESQSTEEITDAHRDLAIRIDNAKREAARLNELLTRQSDRLSDVLEVEQAQARVQTEIEQMTAQETAMRGRAAMSTIQVQVAEQRHAQLALGPLPIGTRIRNAMVDGVRAATESAIGAMLSFIALAPTLLLWLVVVLPPAIVGWWAMAKVVRRRAAR